MKRGTQQTGTFCSDEFVPVNYKDALEQNKTEFFQLQKRGFTWNPELHYAQSSWYKPAFQPLRCWISFAKLPEMEKKFQAGVSMLVPAGIGFPRFQVAGQSGINVAYWRY